MTTTADNQKSTAQRVWEAICDLFDQEQVVTRETLAEVTGLKMTIIDDHVGRMVDNEQVRRVRAGVFVPIPRYDPPRPVYGSMTTDGYFILEVGDCKPVIMQPREARQAGALLAGQFAQFSNIQSAHEAGVVVAEMSVKMRRLERELAALKEKQEPQAQLNLLDPAG